MCAAAGQPTTHRIGDKVTQDGWELAVTSAVLQSYAGRREEGRRYLEVAFVLRDKDERREPLTLGPGDVALTRGVSPPPARAAPSACPWTCWARKSLAEGQGWKFAFTPGKDERGVAAPLALTFRITDAGGAYALSIKDFPPVTIDVPAADDKDEGKKKPPRRVHKIISSRIEKKYT